MALPSFVKDATGLDDGVANGLASSLSKLRDAKRTMATQMDGFDDVLSTIDGESLPSLPTVGDLHDSSSIAEAGVLSKINDLNSITDLAGSCLDGALGSLKSISNNGFGLTKDSLDAFSATPNMPSEMFNIFGLFAGAQQFAASLGIDKLIGDLSSKLGCLSDSSMVSDIQSEVASALNDLGLDSSGLPDDDIYYEKMKTDLTNYSLMNGIDTSWTDSMADGLKVMTTKSNELSGMAKTAANSQMAAAKERIKANVPSTPTPPSFF